MTGTRAGTGLSSPFAGTVPVIVVAAGYGAAAVVWVVAGGALPGGRWLAVHLFTLGVVSNLILGFSDHFARTLTRAGTDRPNRWAWAGLNVGVLLVLVGLPAGWTWMVGVGATTATAGVVAGWRRIRRLRRQAMGARFAWIVRAYERAHGAFVHGAVFGLLMGTGLVAGSWYHSSRLAHLHVNVAGWAVLTLLATLVFFGPTIARARIRPGADRRAARALRAGASGLSVAVLLLFATGAGGSAATVARVGAAGGLAVFAWAATVVCRPVATAAADGGGPASSRAGLVAACAWLPAALWADVDLVATGRWSLLGVIGLAVLLGVLAQTIMTVLGYLAPMVRGSTSRQREAIRRRIGRAGRIRAAGYNLGVLAMVGAAAAGPTAGHAGAVLARAGWGLVLATLATEVLAAAWPPPEPTTAAESR